MNKVEFTKKIKKTLLNTFKKAGDSLIKKIVPNDDSIKDISSLIAFYKLVVEHGIEDLVHTISDYIEVKTTALAKKIINQITIILSSIVKTLLFVASGLFFIFFFSIAIAIWLNQLLDSDFLGFMLVGVLYLISGIILIKISKKAIQKAINYTFRSAINFKDD